MWLSKIERTIITSTFKKIEAPYFPFYFNDADELNPKIKIKYYDCCESKFIPALSKMKNKYIKYEFYEDKRFSYEGKSYKNMITLTDEGYELAEKYIHWFSFIHLWWLEYNTHPIFTVISYIVTLVIGIIIGKCS